MIDFVLKEFEKENEIIKGDIKWKASKDDIDFFKECAEFLHNLGIKTLLDIACGNGEFIKICIDNGIDAYGIDPVIKDNLKNRIYLGTFDSFASYFKNTEIKFDCITIHNTLHGRHHTQESISNLLNTVSKTCDYFVCSKSEFNIDFELIHTFNGSHFEKKVIHHLYKI